MAKETTLTGLSQRVGMGVLEKEDRLQKVGSERNSSHYNWLSMSGVAIIEMMILTCPARKPKRNS